jgi:hypothetical protein
MDYGHPIVISDSSEQVNLNPHEHALMTTPWYAMIFQVLTTAHNGHDLLLGLPISRIIPIHQLYSPHNLIRYLIHSNGKCPNCIHDIPLSSIGIHLQILLFPRFSHIFAIFSKWNWGILLAVRSPHWGNSLFFHCFSQGSEESVESRRSSSENVEWPHKRRKKWRNGAKTIFLGVPLYRWLVYFMEIPPKWNWMRTGGTQWQNGNPRYFVWSPMNWPMNCDDWTSKARTLFMGWFLGI